MNSTLSLPQYAGSESNMQNELPPARHLIGIKCHLNYGGLKEEEPNYHQGLLTLQDHNSHTNNMTEDLMSCEV